jgi:hypothetical protein
VNLTAQGACSLGSFCAPASASCYTACSSLSYRRMRWVRTTRFVVITVSLLISAAMLILSLPDSTELRSGRFRVSRLTLGAISDGNRLTLVALWTLRWQADEVWSWVLRDADFESPARWGARASRSASFGCESRGHSVVRQGWYPTHESIVWLPLWAATMIGLIPGLACTWLEWRCRSQRKTKASSSARAS